MQSGIDRHAADGGVHLRDYWKIVWHGRYTVLVIFAAVLGLTFLRVSFSTPIFEASAVLEIKPEARRVLPGQEQWVGAEGGGWLAEEKYFNTQLEVLKSRDVAKQTFDQLHLKENPRFSDSKDPVGAFASLLQVRPKVNTRLVMLTMSGPDPKEVREWVNTLADVYVKRNVEQATASFNSIMDEIGRGLSDFRAKLETTDTKSRRVAAEAELFVPESQQEVLRASLGTYNDSLAKLRIQIAGLQAELDNYERVTAEGGDVLALPSVRQEPAVLDLVGQRQAVEREIRQLEADKKPGHPEVVAKRGELQKINERIQTQIETIVGKMRTSYNLARRNEAYLESQIKETEERAYHVKEASSAYELEKADAVSRRKTYDLVAETMNRLSVGAQLISMNNNVAVLDRAIEPRRPVKPRKALSMALGGVLGLVLGVVAVLFLDYLDNTIRTQEDVEQHLGLSVLGIIPKYREKDAIIAREAFQSLRTSILFASKGREKRVLLITSAGPQEGKSSTIASIARALASAGDRVIVLDCDLRRPTQHVHMGVPREPGITNYLLDGRDGDVERFVQRTDAPTLSLMSCGPIPPNPPDLLGSKKFRDMLAQLRRTYDWVLIDSPPVSSLADSVVLASISDMMVMVIKHNENDRDLIRRSMKRLRDINVEIIGAVLNGIDLDSTHYGGYYYRTEGERPSGRLAWLTRRKSEAAESSEKKVVL